MVSCYIVGPGDKAPVHMEGDIGIGDIDFNAGMVAMEDMSTDQRRAKMLREKNIYTVGKPGVVSRAYQLAFSVYKAEGLPPESNAFVAVRCSGVVLKTPTKEKNENPSFQTTLLFPVYSPFLNDNVSVKVWNYFFGRANQCIAQVGEEYGLTSDFNLTTLRKVGQVIGTKWYSLYSVREDHRDILGNRTKDGKEYVGRILMRVSLMATDNPQLGVVRSTIGREPKSTMHLLLVDVYELRNATDIGETMWVQAAIGLQKTPKSAHPKFIREEKAFIWDTFERQKIEAVEDVFPLQPEQCPDVFLYVWDAPQGLLNTTERLVGYARVKAKDCISENPVPRWVTIRPIKSGGDSPGELLCTIQFAPKGSMVTRPPVDHELIEYRLVTRIKSGFYMAPNIKEENDLKIHAEIYVGRQRVHLTEQISGRYPVWYLSPYAK